MNKLLSNLNTKDSCESILHNALKRKITLSLYQGDYKNWLKELLPNTRLLIEPLITGIPLILCYKDGYIYKVITKSGIDKTNFFRKEELFPSILPFNKCFLVFGKLYFQDVHNNQIKLNLAKFINDKYFLGEKPSFCGLQILNTNLKESLLSSSAKEFKTLTL